MALTRTNRLLAVGGSILVLVVMMLATVDPQTQYFVDEVMDNPDDFEGQVHLRGEIANNSIDSEKYTFILMGIEHELLVDFSGTAVPDGFNEGKTIIAVPEVGETYVGKVKSIKDFGAFIEFMPGKDGLLHISEIKWERVETMDGVLEEGEEIKVKLIEIDRRTGKFRLSRKALLPKPEKKDK